MIWGYAPAALAANSARDVGGRLAALTIWGKVASGGSYAAIAALTNIPATTLAIFFYQLLLGDSGRRKFSGSCVATKRPRNLIYDLSFTGCSPRTLSPK